MLYNYMLPPDIRDYRMSVFPPFEVVNPFKAIVESGTQKLFTHAHFNPLLHLTVIPPVIAELDDTVALDALQKKSA